MEDPDRRQGASRDGAEGAPDLASAIKLPTALEDALAAAQRANEAKTAFLSNVSHDMRTPMNAIAGFTQLALDEIDDREAVRGYLEKIRVASNHLLALINDVLDMSRIESGKIQLNESTVNLPEFLEGLETIVAPEIRGKHLALAVTRDIRDEDVVVDRVRLSQVLLNIMSNAVKYTPDGGTVSFDVAQLEDTPSGYASYRFSVVDNGIGMAPEFMERLFNPFERAASTTASGVEGTGLGLAIVKSVVDMMGGSISVDSREGEGSAFTVDFAFKTAANGLQVPAGADGSAGTQPGETRADDSAGTQPGEAGADDSAGAQPGEAGDWAVLSGRRALVVDDSEMNREIVARLLGKVGMSVETAADGDEAVERVARAGAGRFDVVLMDVMMPRMDGCSAARAIRSLEDPEVAGVPILAITAAAFEEDRRRAAEAGMDGHIAKPFKRDLLYREVAAVLS